MSTPKPESSGPPLRALAMVLIALAILFAGLGFASLGGSDSEETAATVTTSAAATTTAARPTTAAGAAGGTSASAASTTSGASSTTKAADAASVPVRVLNNSNVTGLASQTATELMSSGWTVSETGNYSDSTISETTVYYGTSAAEKEAAIEIAAQLGVSAEPKFPGIANSSAGVVVIVTSAQ
ncbi:glycoprotein [Rhodococcus sp. ACS1]|uniref:LytR cell envelope-related transcriptional attenuator n=1 Tax=Rhodococcus koreensis TaxID=99653 RepID=A0A1H4YPV1_9NOCA|nr:MULTISPECIES: LytR C-terminal domain-containing protein [Rhodococcus]PBC48804.1 glycoprotein [Rhodococcus sp. ACS1]QSE79703.1 LytR C-terminal domain-containing protein [Rhodococcus koreensis]SED19857.1 LytR cell envelope-related transcriptional attenuator [Rhodococcus koreensis]